MDFVKISHVAENNLKKSYFIQKCLQKTSNFYLNRHELSKITPCRKNQNTFLYHGPWYVKNLWKVLGGRGYNFFIAKSIKSTTKLI